MSGALQRYRVMAWVTGVVLLSATIWAIVGYTMLGYSEGGDKPPLYTMLWVAHGWLYFVYLIAGVDLTFRLRWSLWATVGVLLAGTIPGASFFAERWVTKKARASHKLGADLRDRHSKKARV
jgi:integral membrane protein